MGFQGVVNPFGKTVLVVRIETMGFFVFRFVHSGFRSVSPEERDSGINVYAVSVSVDVVFVILELLFRIRRSDREIRFVDENESRVPAGVELALRSVSRNAERERSVFVNVDPEQVSRSVEFEHLLKFFFVFRIVGSDYLVEPFEIEIGFVRKIHASVFSETEHGQFRAFARIIGIVVVIQYDFVLGSVPFYERFL